MAYAVFLKTLIHGRKSGWSEDVFVLFFSLLRVVRNILINESLK